MQTINLKIKIDNKEANASLELTNDNIKELYKSFKYGKQQVNGLTTQISMGFNNAREILGGVRETYQSITSLFAKPINAFADLEQANISFEVMLGNGEKAKRLVEDLREYGATTPLQFTGLQKSAQTLLAFGIEGERVIPILRQLGDISLGDQQKLNSLTLAFAQVQSAGKLMGQDLLQMINVGFNPLQIISQQTGKTVGELKDEMSKGAISAEMVAEAFETATSQGGKYNGMLEKMSDSTGGLLSNFADNMTTIQQTTGEALAGALNPLLSHINKITASLNQNHAWVIKFVGGIGTAVTAFGILNTTGVLPLILRFGTLKTAMQLTRKQFDLMKVGGYSAAGGFRVAGTAAKGFFASLGPIGWAVMGITALVEIMSLFGNETDESSEAIKRNANETIELIKQEKLHTQELIDNGVEVEANMLKLDKLSDAMLRQQKIIADADIDSYTQKLQNAESDLLDSSAFFFVQFTDKQSLISNLMDEHGKDYIAMNKVVEENTERLGEILNKNRIEPYLSTERLAEIKDELGKWREVAEEVGEAAKAQQFLNDKIEYRKNLSKDNNIVESDSGENVEITNLNKIAELKEKVKKLTKEYGQLSVTEAAKRKSEYENEIRAINKQIKNLELNTKVKVDIEIPEVPKIDLPKELEDIELGDIKFSEDYQQLMNMKLDTMDEGYAKEEAIRQANYKADLKAYKDVTGAKEIIDNFYRKEKERQDIQSALTSVQTSMDALNFIAQAVNQYTVVGKAIAIAQATWNTYQAATAALGAQPWGPWNIALAAMVTAAGIANVTKIAQSEPPKMQAFYHGGRFKKGEAGYIEGLHNEIIAPEKTFVEVFKNELRPQIVGDSKYAVNDNGELINEMRMTRQAIEELKGDGLKAYLSEKDFNNGANKWRKKTKKSMI